MSERTGSGTGRRREGEAQNRGGKRIAEAKRKNPDAAPLPRGEKKGES